MLGYNELCAIITRLLCFEMYILPQIIIIIIIAYYGRLLYIGI
jgi:hypothetical protein